MSWGLGSAMNVSITSMLAKQKEMSIASSNISNVDNPYYHKRSAVIESLDIAGNNSYGGTGVYLASVHRFYNAELERSLQNAIAIDSYQQDWLTRLRELENILGPGGENYLAIAVGGFAGSMQLLATAPDSINSRAGLLANAASMTSEFNQQYANMATLRDAIAGNDAAGKGYLSAQITEVNSLLEQLATLNHSVYRLEQDNFRKQPALDLRDERDKTVKLLAAFADVTIYEENNGQYTVTLNLEGGGSVVLIDGTTIPQAPAEQLQMNMVESPAGFFTPQLTLASDPATPVSLNTGSGSLRALLDAREYITAKMSELYDFAKALATEINQLQQTGYDLDGNLSTGNFFSVPDTQPAKGSIIALDNYVRNDPRKIAAADQPGQQGNSNQARAMWNILNESDLYNSQSLMSYSDYILSDVALLVSQAGNAAKTSASILDMFKTAVAEYSSISMDEEMVNMLSLQRAYQAAAKMISTIDRMFETVINMV